MKKKDPHGRLARWAYEIQTYDMEVIHRPGQDNQNADALSRAPLPTIGVITRVKQEKLQNDWKSAQSEDDYCKEILEKLNDNKITKPIGFNLNKEGILITSDGKFVVPRTKVMEILKMNHDHMLAGHLGIAKSLARIKRQYSWPGLGKDVTTYVNNCLTCAKRKAYGSSKAPLKPLPIVAKIWEQIAMDVVGPVTESSSGNKYILVLSDYASRYVITIPMEDQKAHTIAEHLVKKVYTKYGPPERVLTDKGTNFLSKLIAKMCTLFKIKQIKTTSYHPQTDGLVERFNRTLCDMLPCYVTDEPECWDKYLDFVTFAYNTAKQTSIDCCPFYLFYKREPIIPSDIPSNRNIEVFEDDNEEYEKQWQRALERSQNRLAQAQEKQKQLYDQGSKLVTYKPNDHVLLRAQPSPGKFNNRWLGPYKINRQISDVNYEILILREDSKDLEDEAKFIVHVNRLKLVSNTPNEQLTVPNKAKVIKRRGRPPKVVQVPKRRGRPPSLTRKDDKSQPKRRGRPPKIQEVAKVKETIITQAPVKDVDISNQVTHRYPLRNRK